VTQTPSKGDAASSLVSLDHLTSLKVVDDAGTLVGTISSITIEPTTGHVVDVAVHRGGVFGLGGTTTRITVAEILSVGPELLTVTTQHGDQAEEGTDRGRGVE
jgi:sporulation protein YlmC with PRC-barrel domain